jgi:hypothetical protein
MREQRSLYCPVLHSHRVTANFDRRNVTVERRPHPVRKDAGGVLGAELD